MTGFMGTLVAALILFLIGLLIAWFIWGGNTRDA
jgi:HAMP domain-containing protein